MSTPFDQPSTAAKSADPEGGTGAYSYDGKPDRWKRYRLPDPVTGKPGGFTRATTFAKSISDTFSLSAWSQRMVAIGLAQRADLLMAVASTSADDKEKLNSLAEEAKNHAGAKVGANLGTALHAFSEAVDRGENPNIPPPYQPHLAAYTALLEQYGLRVLDIERVVLCEEYDGKGVAGTLDRIVEFTRDVTVEVAGGGSHTFKAKKIAILDLKTAKTLEYGGLEIAVQLSTYARAKVRFDKEAKKWIPMPENMDQQVAIVVHLPATAPGETVKAVMYAVDIAAGHEMAQLCTAVREARKRKGLLTPLAVVDGGTVKAETFDPNGYAPDSSDGEMPRIQVTEPHEPTLMDRVTAARTRDELNTLWFDAIRLRQDTQELAAAIGKRARSLLADSAAG